VFQAGPPAYVIGAFGAVIVLLVCAPLMILASVLIISLAVTALVVGLVGAVVVVSSRVVRELHAYAAHRARLAQRKTVEHRRSRRPRGALVQRRVA
jgi:hypothetical protein